MRSVTMAASWQRVGPIKAMEDGQLARHALRLCQEIKNLITTGQLGSPHLASRGRGSCLKKKNTTHSFTSVLPALLFLLPDLIVCWSWRVPSSEAWILCVKSKEEQGSQGQQGQQGLLYCSPSWLIVQSIDWPLLLRKCLLHVSFCFIKNIFI